MEQNISEIAVEINSVFDNMSDDLLAKIPLNIREYFKNAASDSYVFNYDASKTLDKQSFKDKTKGIIAVLYRDYLCTESEKKEYLDLYTKYLNQKNEEKKQLYNPNLIFKNKSNITSKDNDFNTSTSLTNKKDNFFTKLFNKIFFLLNKTK